MKWVHIEDISEYNGQSVEIRGWVFNTRKSGKLLFILLRDGTGIIQTVTLKNDVGEEAFSLAKSLTQESSLIVRGIVREDERAPGGYELSVKEIEPIHITRDYPITPKEHGVGFLMNKRHLWIRSRRQNAILRIRAEIISAVRDYLNNKKFVLIDAPIFTPSACEGTTTLFNVDYFGKPAYLSQSGQLYNEAACMAFGNVYCFGPAFRAEKSKTRRHLTEFWQVEPEMAFAHMEDAMEIAEGMVSYTIERVLENRKKELETIERDVTKLESIKTPFPRISYTDAVKKISQLGEKVEWGEDFGSPQETVLANSFESPFFVHRFPVNVKAFYMRRDPDDRKLSLSFDMLAPEGYGEIVGGGEREYDIDTLLKRIKEYNLPEEAFKWYLDLRRYGAVPHAGFGLGIERTVAWICKLPHIRETIPFPRMLDIVYP
ncbi:asparagine--tRNA ligase [candidate division WOR-3 bacterium]|nr:asparagine--tRNA ligase [candidate division WOR-3 bacterium]